MPGTRERPGRPSWFQDSFGFDEEQQSGVHGSQLGIGHCGYERQRILFDATREHFEVKDKALRCRATGKHFGGVGDFEMLSVRKLRDKLAEAERGAPDSYWSAGDLSFQHMVGEAYELHQDPANAGAVFQVASLFNCLETSPPGRLPEDGLACYAAEACQGAACARACPAATVFRNYLVNGRGQTKDDQIDCLSDVGELVGNESEGYWTMRSGYCMPKAAGGIARLSRRLKGDPRLVEEVKASTQVGVHWAAEVARGGHEVCQVFSSALPVGLVKGSARAGDWETFACALLHAEFDAALTAGTVVAARTGMRARVFLTLLGGGSLGNRRKWITDALDCALSTHKSEPLDVVLVHFGSLPTDSSLRALEHGRKPRAAMKPQGMAPQLAKPKPKRLAADALQQQLVAVRAEINAHGKCKLDKLHQSFHRFDSDGDGTIDRQELAEVESFRKANASQVALAFAFFDANGDGVADRKEFVDVLQVLDASFFTPGTVNILLEEADADGDGVVHYTEFFAWLFDEDPALVAQVLQSAALTGEASF